MVDGEDAHECRVAVVAVVVVDIYKGERISYPYY